MGFELPGPLLDRASAVAARFTKEIRQYLSTESIQDVDVRAGGFLQHDWSDADVAFANTSCFDEELLEDLAVKCAQLKEGALVVTLGEQLAVQRHLELVLQRPVLSTAGPIQAYVHRVVAQSGDRTATATATTNPPGVTPPRPHRVGRLIDEESASFAPLTSPQDSELMRRKRAGRSFPDS